jgi:RES domain-containing protein
LKITAWRIVLAKRATTAFSGEGGRLNGGRWNNKGTAIVYTASSISLASMEILVNLPSPTLLARFVRIPVEFDEALVSNPTRLPPDWQRRPAGPETKAIGDDWAAAQGSAVLKVPSLVVPEEFNYLLNPSHSDWDKIHIKAPIAYPFDPRLAR